MARGVALVVRDVRTVGIRNRPTRNGERVVADEVSGRRAPRPCGIVRAVCRRVGGVRVVVETEAIGVDVAICVPCMIIRVDDELIVADRALLDADGRIGVRRSLHEIDAVLIVHKDEEMFVVGLRRKAVRGLHDLDARPVHLIRRAARDLEQCVADRLMCEVEIRLAEVLHAAHGDVLAKYVQRVVRHDIARISAITAVQKYAAHREIICPERDRIARRRRASIAAGIAAVDVHARAERAARDRYAIARRLACGHGIDRNVRICRELPTASRRSAAIDFGAIAERTARDRDLVIRRVPRALGIASVDCRVVPDRAARDIDFVRLRVARRHEM